MKNSAASENSIDAAPPVTQKESFLLKEAGVPLLSFSFTATEIPAIAASLLAEEKAYAADFAKAALFSALQADYTASEDPRRAFRAKPLFLRVTVTAKEAAEALRLTCTYELLSRGKALYQAETLYLLQREGKNKGKPLPPPKQKKHLPSLRKQKKAAE